MTKYLEHHHPQEEHPKIEISESAMNRLNKFLAELETLFAWLQNIRPMTKELGNAHLSGDKTEMRKQQNALWQSFQKEIWQKNLFKETENFADADSGVEEKMILNKLVESLTLTDYVKGEAKKNYTPHIQIGEIRSSLYNQLEQHWFSDDYTNKDEQPKKLEEFVFRVSLWIEDVAQIKKAVEDFKKNCSIKPI